MKYEVWGKRPGSDVFEQYGARYDNFGAARHDSVTACNEGWMGVEVRPVRRVRTGHRTQRRSRISRRD